MQCVEDITRSISEVYEKLLHTAPLLLQAHEINVGVFTGQCPVCCAWALKPNRYTPEQSKGYLALLGFVDYPLGLFDYVRGWR